MISKIIRAYVRRYRDNGQTTAYVEWIDIRGRAGRTEGPPRNTHMLALFARARREGAPIERQTW